MANGPFVTGLDMAGTLTNERTNELTDDYQDKGRKSSVPNTPTPVNNDKLVAVEGVKLRGNAWWKLADVAEKRNLTVAQLVAHIAEVSVADPSRLPERDTYGRPTTPTERRKMTPRRLARLRELHALGMSDGEISSHIGLSDEAVRQWRNRLRLPVIRRGPRKQAHPIG